MLLHHHKIYLNQFPYYTVYDYDYNSMWFDHRVSHICIKVDSYSPLCLCLSLKSIVTFSGIMEIIIDILSTQEIDVELLVCYTQTSVLLNLLFKHVWCSEATNLLISCIICLIKTYLVSPIIHTCTCFAAPHNQHCTLSVLINNYLSGPTSHYQQSLCQFHLYLSAITPGPTSIFISNHSPSSTSMYQESLSRPHQYVSAITLPAPPVCISNHSPGPTSMYQQSLSRPHQYVSVITLLAPPVCISNHSPVPTSMYQQSLSWPNQSLSAITPPILPVLISNHSPGPTSPYQQSLSLPHQSLSAITLPPLPVLINNHSPWSYQSLSAITLPAPPGLISNHPPSPTSPHQQSLYQPHQALSAITLLASLKDCSCNIRQIL